MRDLIILAIHLLVTLVKMMRPGGVRAVAAESLVLKQRLLIMDHSGQRAPNLTSLDRFLLGLATLCKSPRRINKVAAILQPTTLLRFHRALIDRQYRLLFSSSGSARKPGPKGPSALEWLDMQSKPIDARTFIKKKGRFEDFAFPYLGKTPISHIRSPELLAVLQKIEVRGKHETAHRVWSECAAVFRLARLEKQIGAIDAHFAPPVQMVHSRAVDLAATLVYLRELYSSSRMSEIFCLPCSTRTRSMTPGRSR